MRDESTFDVDGRPARLHEAGEAAPGTPGVVVLHAWWGLVDDVIAFADRLAGAGFAVIAPDLVDGATASTVDAAEALVGAADDARAEAVTLAAVDRLAATLGEDARIGVVGFSFGAAYALWVPARRPVVRATVAYYGTMLGPALAGAASPVLGHFAADDPFEPEDSVVALESALRDAGREATLHRYPGTGHWFAEPSRDAFVASAADEAFERTVAFLREALAG